MVRTELDRVLRDCAQSTSCRFGFVQQAPVPKEVLHTRARERLLEHFLSDVSRPSRVPPLNEAEAPAC